MYQGLGLDNLSASEQPYNEQDDCNNKEKMDKPASDISNESEEPKHNENDSNCL